MTQLAKLHRKLLQGRPLSFVEFVRLLEAFGYERVRAAGSHIAYRNEAIRDTRIIQPRGKDAKSYQVRQFLDIIEANGLELGA
jgi:predicted RNA binding protein YcfA (HicA-like mRNA interferase family)